MSGSVPFSVAVRRATVLQPPTRVRSLDEMEMIGERAIRRDTTARKRLGRKVRSVSELVQIAELRRSVYVEGCLGLKPAAFVGSMQAIYVNRLIKSGRVYHYHPAKRKITP